MDKLIKHLKGVIFMSILREVVLIKYRILDINGDYSFGKGQQNLTYG